MALSYVCNISVEVGNSDKDAIFAQLRGLYLDWPNILQFSINSLTDDNVSLESKLYVNLG